MFDVSIIAAVAPAPPPGTPVRPAGERAAPAAGPESFLAFIHAFGGVQIGGDANGDAMPALFCDQPHTQGQDAPAPDASASPLPGAPLFVPARELTATVVPPFTATPPTADVPDQVPVTLGAVTTDGDAGGIGIDADTDTGTGTDKNIDIGVVTAGAPVNDDESGEAEIAAFAGAAAVNMVAPIPAVPLESPAPATPPAQTARTSDTTPGAPEMTAGAAEMTPDTISSEATPKPRQTTSDGIFREMTPDTISQKVTPDVVSQEMTPDMISAPAVAASQTDGPVASREEAPVIDRAKAPVGQPHRSAPARGAMPGATRTPKNAAANADTAKVAVHAAGPVVAADSIAATAVEPSASENTDDDTPRKQNIKSAAPVTVRTDTAQQAAPSKSSVSDDAPIEKWAPATARPAIAGPHPEPAPAHAITPAIAAPVAPSLPQAPRGFASVPALPSLAQPAATIGAPASDTVSQLIQSIRLQWTRGGGDAVIKLEPRHFGDVSVTVRVDQGQVVARLQVEAPAAREWLQNNHAWLRSSLSDHGLTLDRLEVTESSAEARDDEDSRSDRRSAREDHPPRRSRRPATGALFETFV